MTRDGRGAKAGRELLRQNVPEKGHQKSGTERGSQQLAPVLTIASVEAGQLQVVGIGAVSHCR